MEEQIVGNRNYSTGMDLPKKPSFNLYCDASGQSKSLTPEVDLKAKSMNLLYILLVPATAKITMKIKLMFTRLWISFLRLPLPLDVYKEVVIPQLCKPIIFCDFLTRSYDTGGVVSVMALSSLFLLMMQRGFKYRYFNEKEDGESESKDDLKMEEQIVGNRNYSTGMDLPKKPIFNLFCDASGQSKSLTPEVDLKAKSMNLLYILLVNLLPFNIFLVPSTDKITMKIKLMFTRLWIPILRLPLPLDVYKEAVIPQLSKPIIFCDFLTRSYDIGGVVSVMALSSVFIIMMQRGFKYRYFNEKEDGESESKSKDDLKMEEQIVGNRNYSTGMDLPKKPSFNLFCDASGQSKSLTPEVDLKAKSMNLLYILLVPSTAKITMKIKLMFTRLWISFLRLPLPLDVYKEAVIPQLSKPIIFCDFLTRSYDIGGVVSVMALSSVFILMMQRGFTYRYFNEKEDGKSESKDDLKMEEQIVGNRNYSTGMDLPKKPSFNLFCDASGQSKSLTPEVDPKAKSMNLLYILLVPSTAKITMKIKLMFTRLWISFLRLPLPLDVYKEAVIPQLCKPIIFCDFLTRSYDIGGVVSVMAVSSVFILMMQRGFKYRYFNEKVPSTAKITIKRKLMFTRLWISFLRLPLPLDVYKEAVIPQLCKPIIFCDFLTRSYDIGGVVSVMAVSSVFILMMQRGFKYRYFNEKEDGKSESKDDLKMEEQIVGNRNYSTGMDLPKKPSFNLFCDASGQSKSLTPEVDPKAKSMNLLYILLVPSTAKITMKIKLMFTRLWISFLRLPLPLDVYKEAVIPQLSNPIIFCDFLTRSYDIGGVVSVMALSGVFILMMQRGFKYRYFNEKEDGESESKSKDDLKMEEQIVGNRNYSTGMDLPKKPSFNLCCDASGQSKSLTPEVDLKAKSMNLLYILLVPSTAKITMKIKLMFTRLWISFLRLPLPLDVYKEAVMPRLCKPIIFCDFLTRSYDIGGVVSVMAVSSVFILMMQRGFKYRYFNEKLLGSCLTSLLLPAFLAAAFAKKLSGLARSVLRLGALVIVAPIYSLFRRHPSICCLVHRVSCKRMATRSPLLSLLLLLLLLRAPRAVSEVGTASYYSPPYERTECYGEGSSQFPESNLFVAVGDGLWDLGRACGREYEVRCIGDAQSGPGPCKPGSGSIRVKAVDYALSVESSATAPRQSVTGADLVLSQAAFEVIANPFVESISVEFKEL